MKIPFYELDLLKTKIKFSLPVGINNLFFGEKTKIKIIKSKLINKLNSTLKFIACLFMMNHKWF